MSLKTFTQDSSDLINIFFYLYTYKLLLILVKTQQLFY